MWRARLVHLDRVRRLWIGQVAYAPLKGVDAVLPHEHRVAAARSQRVVLDGDARRRLAHLEGVCCEARAEAAGVAVRCGAR